MSSIPHSTASWKPGVAVAPNAWIRRHRRTGQAGVLAVLWSLGFASIVFLPHDDLHASVGGYFALAAFFGGLPAVGLVFARRLFTAGLWMSSDGIVLRNPVRTLTLGLNDVEGFVAGVASGIGNGTPCPLLRRHHGRAVGVWALGREGVVWRFGKYVEEIQPLCDELNALLHELQLDA